MEFLKISVFNGRAWAVDANEKIFVKNFDANPNKLIYDHSPAATVIKSCSCNYTLTFKNQKGRTEGSCKYPDKHSNKYWCYTIGLGACEDEIKSVRFHGKSWSYMACKREEAERQCACNNNLTLKTKEGKIAGGCRLADKTGKKWCYTTKWGVCEDEKKSQRYIDNPWSYKACI